MAENFELLRNVTIGQYIPTGSVIHRLDPRAKLIALTLIIVAFTITLSPWITLALVGLVFGIARLARIPFAYLARGLLPILPFLFIIFVLQIIFRGLGDVQGRVIFEWWFLRITENSWPLATVGILRVIAFLSLASLLTLTTTTTHLTHGIESLLSPLRLIGFPAHEIALVFAIAFRFVPTLIEELDRVARAQASRLGNIGATTRWRLDKTLRARLPLIVPLFLSALRRGEELILAMEARCYVSGAGRTRFWHFTPTTLDYAVVIGAFALVAVVWWLGSRVG
ncbi:MAG: energy-coupling factor transporter transmembrane component T [Anaerolineales bacterium]|nr:energy-coupling factor transporter transmembrane component T [Anaerolineales bacterium]